MKSSGICIPHEDFVKFLKTAQSLYNQQMNLLSTITYLASEIKQNAEDVKYSFKYKEIEIEDLGIEELNL